MESYEHVIPTWEQLERVAPIALIVICIAGVGFMACRWLTNNHISSLNDFIEYLKQERK